jgi:carbon monoxide dehydrogenase subunit G
MPGFTLTKDIAAPPAVVFAWFTDLDKAAVHIKAIKKIEKLTEGPIGQGTRFKETRFMFGKEATETMEIAALEPNRSYTVTAHSCGAQFNTVFRFLPSAIGTALEVDFSTKAASLLAKVFTPLSWLMMGSMKKCIEQDVEDMKQAIEAVQGKRENDISMGTLK